MKRFAIMLGFALCASAAAPAEDGAKWIVQPPTDVAKAKKEEIPPSDVFEVVASKIGVAISGDLAKKGFVEISEQRAKWFTGAYFSCPKGKKPFLVRAVYGFGGTGHYRLERVGDALWVSHESLGDDFVASRSALVVNLAFSPTTEYTTVSIAR